MCVEGIVLKKLSAIEKGQREAIELLTQLVRQEEARAEADGPVTPNKFRFNSVEYDVSPSQLTLLICLWGREPRRIEDVEDELYGHDHEKTRWAVPSLCGRLNKRLFEQSCPLSVHRRGGFLVLDLG